MTLEVGGARLDPATARRVRPEFGATLTQWFGMAEGLLCCTRSSDPDELAATTQGRPPSAADELRVVDAEGHDVPAGEVGERLCRGPYTLRGYYRAGDHNARTFTPDGVFRTGDLVRLTPTGELQVTGRVKDGGFALPTRRWRTLQHQADRAGRRAGRQLRPRRVAAVGQGCGTAPRRRVEFGHRQVGRHDQGTATGRGQARRGGKQVMQVDVDLRGVDAEAGERRTELRELLDCEPFKDAWPPGRSRRSRP